MKNIVSSVCIATVAWLSLGTFLAQDGATGTNSAPIATNAVVRQGTPRAGSPPAWAKWGTNSPYVALGKGRTNAPFHLLIASNAPPTTATLSAVGPNSRTWTISASNSTSGGQSNVSSSGKTASHRIVEMNTGMHYWDGQKWTASNPSFETTNDGFVANRTQHKVHLAPDLNVAGAVNVTTRDGLTLNSTPMGIGLYDAASGNFTLIASLTNSTGVLVASNKVVYPNAFAGICANVVYTMKRGAFHQDVVLTGQVNPATYGFPPETTRIQVVTEFFNTPEPLRKHHVLHEEKDKARRKRMASPDVVDETLGFGEFVLGSGNAFSTNTSTNRQHSAPVGKEFKTVDGRKFLLETVEYGSIQSELQTLPPCNAQSGGTGAKLKKVKPDVGYAALTRPPQPSKLYASRSVIPHSTTPTQLALLASSTTPGVVIDYVASVGSTLNDEIVFAGDATYLISGPVFCNGNAIFEGGVVLKYTRCDLSITGCDWATIQLNNSFNFAGTSYHPVICTASDDDSIGDSMYNIDLNYTGDPQGNVYADPAFTINAYYYIGGINNLRVSYATVAIVLTNAWGLAISDSSFVNCAGAIDFGGGYGMTIVMNNCLLANVAYPFANGYDNYCSLCQCTIDNVVMFDFGDGEWFSITNCIFSNDGEDWSSYNIVGAGYNGFYNCAAFGVDPIIDDQNPFALVYYVDPFDNKTYYSPVNGQGAYYLRPGSPFVNAGWPDIGPDLQNDLAQRTTAVPPMLFTDDVIASRTLGPIAVRDSDTPDIGYHYPVVDYVINGATVNDCTLNISPGTVLAFGGLPGLQWGLLLNPGGRLNVNGMPTNRVVFAHLEAIQESPYWPIEPIGPMISWREYYLPFTGANPTPYPEANIRYADFPTIAGGQNGHIDVYDDHSYMLFSHIQLESCLFQAAWIFIDDGGPPGRTLDIHNTVFERCDVGMFDSGVYAYFLSTIGLGPQVNAQVTIANNLFYQDGLDFYPSLGENSTSWTFVDNIFDNVQFFSGQNGPLYNGPVGVNNHNAYVNMANIPIGNRLAPAAPTSTDPDLPSLNYEMGPLGRFYLPTSATLLIDKGSRLAADAGLYHFTTSVNNTKEGATAVDIGPHYVALQNGAPIDSDGDGVPDFAEDANGNGIADANETSWLQEDGELLKIVGLPDGVALPAGEVPIHLWAAPTQGTLNTVGLLVNGIPLITPRPMRAPFVRPLTFELDTMRLANGLHTLQANAIFLLAGQNPPYTEVQTDPITVFVNNPITFPAWAADFEGDPGQFNIATQQPNAPYEIDIYDYPCIKGGDPILIKTLSGSTTDDGSISANWDLSGYTDTDLHPIFFSQTILPDGVHPNAINPLSAQTKDNYPSQGMWVVAVVDWITSDTGGYGLWHGIHTSIAGIGERKGGVIPPADVITKSGQWRNPGEPFMLRMRDLNPNVYPFDWDVLLDCLGDPRVRNFYYNGHGNPSELGDGSGSPYGVIDSGDIADHLHNRDVAAINQRYRFVFLDGCSTAAPNGSLPAAFGLGTSENKQLVDYHTRPGLFIGWDADIPAGWGNVDSNHQLTRASGGSVNTRYCQFVTKFLFDLDELHYSAIDAYNDAIGLLPGAFTTHWKMFGYWGMTLDSYNQSQNWPPTP